MDHNDHKKPGKGILKPSSSFDKQEKAQKRKSTKWDEMNIMATFHPPDKDYGHMKVEEPKTPYNWDYSEDNVDSVPSMTSEVDPCVLREKLAGTAGTSRRRSTPSESDDDEDEDESNLDECERARRREFRNRRKQHYNEFKAVQLARKLIEEEDDDDEVDESGDTDAPPNADKF